MKIHQIITESILLEYNIINNDKINNILDLFLKEKEVTDIFVINWLKKKVNNYINSTGKFLNLYNPTEDDKQKYPWLNKAIDNNQEIYRFTEVAGFRMRVDSVIDWVKSLNKEDEDYKKLDRISFEQALERHDRWMKKNDGILRDDSKLVKTIYSFPDGYKIVELPDDFCKTREGQLMGHCVGQGKYSGKTIFSLRDRKNNPHATLELKGNRVVQLQGKENKDVVEKYHPYLQEFFTNSEYTLTEGYYTKIGLIKLNNEVYKINEIPDGLVIENETYTDLENCEILTKLPNNLTVNHYLNLNGCINLVKIGDNLKVGTNLDLGGCVNLVKIGDNLRVGHVLNLSNCTSLARLPYDTKVGSSVILDRYSKIRFPEHLKILRKD